MDWLGLVFFSVFILMFFFLAIFSFRLMIKVKSLDREVQKGILEYFILADKYKESLNNSEKEKVEKTEGFLKFVSDSRDAAFTYIEEVQESIKELKGFTNNLDGDVFYLNEEDLFKFKSVSAKIISYLPEDK
jgi:hypothetical protein